MRRLVAYHLLMAFLLVLACSYFLRGNGGAAQPTPENGQYIRNLTMTSTLLATDFVPDGNLSKKVWRDAHRVMIDRDRFGKTRLPDLETQVASRWTPGYVYFAYWCRYQSLYVFTGEDPVKERPNLCIRDVVEAFINPQPERFRHYYEFEMAPNNQWWDIEINLDKNGNIDWDSHFDHATKIDAEHKIWTLEMRIPVRPMNVDAIHAGDEWRLNHYRSDGAGDDTQKHYMAWSSLPDGHNGSFHQPECFGIIKFVK